MQLTESHIPKPRITRSAADRGTATKRPTEARQRPGAGLKDRRPSAVAQLRLAKLINESPRVTASFQSFSPRNRPVVQRVIAYNAGQAPAGLRAGLTAAMTGYNGYAGAHLADNTEGSLHEQFRLLDIVEHAINNYLRLYGGAVSDPERVYLFGLLRGAETDHVALTQRNILHGRALWLRDGAALGGAERGRRGALWQSLTAQTGNIQVQGSAASQARTQAGFARLLQGAHGTGLLEELNAPQPAHADRGVVISDNLTANYAAHRKVSGPGSFAAGMAQVISGADRHTMGHAGPNVGTGSFVQVAPQVPATLEEHGVDTGGRALFSPHFVTLGHELGHARHMLRGTIASPVWGAHALADPLERMLWSEPEEHANITAEENPIRAEHQMPERRYHTTLRGAQALRNRHTLKANIDAVYDSLTPAQHRTYDPALQDLENELQYELDIYSAAAVATFQAKIVALRNRIWWANVRGGVRSALTPTRGKVLALGLLALAGATYALNAHARRRLP